MLKVFKRIRQRLLAESNFKKYLAYAIGEIILVVIGILIALQINTWNTSRINENRAKNYAKSLIQDLSSDIEMISESQRQARNTYWKIDSLKSYMASTDPSKLSNTDLFILTYDILYRPYKWSRSTLIEMKSAEVLQYFKNDSLKIMLIEYESSSSHLDEDFVGDQTNADRASELAAEILNLNTPYFERILNLELDSISNIFYTDEYKDSKNNDLKLISYEEGRIGKLVNTLIQIQAAYRIRAFLEMENMKKNARELIQLLKAEY